MMGSKRIYLGRESSKYAKIAGGAIIAITSLFFVLMIMGFEITGSDDYCSGTLEDPCVSYGKICNLGPDNYDIYNPESVKLDFSPEIQDHWIFFKDGRVKKEMLYDLGINASTKGWRYENFTNATKPRKDRVYVHRFARYSCQDYMLVGLKNNPDEVIKWGFGVGREYLDPFWYAINATPDTLITDLNLELGHEINLTANITGVSDVCVDIDHPDYGINYTCGSPSANFLLNITYFRKNELNDSSTEKNLSFYGPENQTVHIYAHQYDEVNNLSLNLTGYETNGTYPSIKIYVNNTLSNTIGLIFAGEQTETELSDGNSSSEMFFDPAGEIHTVYVEIPKNAEVSSAEVNLSSYSQEMDYTGTSFDGGLAGWSIDGIAYLDGYFWIVDAINSRVSKYTTNGVYTGTYLSISSGITQYGVVGYNGTLWFVSDANNKIYEYWTNGTAKSDFSTDAANAAPYGIAYYDGSFYIGDDTDKKYYRYFVNGTYTGSSYDTAAVGNIVPGGGTTNGTYIWFIDYVADEIYKYFMNGTWTEESFDIAAAGNEIGFSITTNNTYIWATDSEDDEVYRYLMDGTAVDSWDTNAVGNTGPMGITTNNTYIWVVDFLSDEVYKYWMNGTHTGEKFNGSANGNDAMVGITTNGTYIWITDSTDDEIYKYFMNGTWTGDSFDTAVAGNTGPSDLATDNNFIWIVDGNNKRVYKYFMNGTYTGDKFIPRSNEKLNTGGIIESDGYFWAVDWAFGDADSNQVYKYWTNWTYTGESYDIFAEDIDFSGITEYNEYLWLMDFGADVYKYKGLTYPEDSFMEAGIFDGTWEWNYTGIFNTTDRTSNFNSSINDFLAICTADSDGDCTVPIYLRSEAIGVLNISGIEIKYSYDPNPVYLDVDLVSAFLGNSTNFADIPITISNTQNGTVEITDIRYDYAGGNDTIEILVYEQGDKTNNETLNIITYYSSFFKNLPYTWTDYIFFLPRTNSSKNVSAYKQTSTIPVFNMTTTNYGGKNMNFSIKMNETSACLNITWSTTSTKPAGNKMNSTWQEVATNLEYLNNTQIWLWADLEDCNATGMRILNERIQMESYCIDCAWSGQ